MESQSLEPFQASCGEGGFDRISPSLQSPGSGLRRRKDLMQKLCQFANPSDIGIHKCMQINHLDQKSLDKPEPATSAEL